ncbi:hypothetical protein [Kerstersia gyiorum]|uniref:Uncharacterized protein n=1 Tax=Kerstersia gyiorum TaxID=206506 RepID=A0A171KUG5_9BURK|nr:hypothetical protein [Kerstersia gyiorum]KKO72532.1 hypothetical protein AAV32_05685 [Kerstersia gyiorum]
MQHFKLSALACAVLLVTACGGSNDKDDTSGVTQPGEEQEEFTREGASLNDIVKGAAGYGVPEGAEIPVTVMGQMKYFFDRIAAEGVDMEMNLGDGTASVKVLDPNTGDQFLPGKVALGLSHVLIDMKKNQDPDYEHYLEVYRSITATMMSRKPGSSEYLYDNKSFGEYFYLLALNRLRDAGMLDEVFDAGMLATLQERLTYRDLFTGDPASYNLNAASNYYAVAYAIAGLRDRLGWGNDPVTGRDDILKKLQEHYRARSSEGFSDETDGDGRFDRYSVLLIAEVAQRSMEMDNSDAFSEEMKGWLRKSVDLILPQLNTDGIGFIYGRSIGPYGDTAFAEILTAAARMGVLREDEMEMAYAIVQAVAQRYMTFWYDEESHSVNMWVKGRGTDSYRATRRVLGENLSLAHHLIYINERWRELGYNDKRPMSHADLQRLLDQRQPRFLVSHYDRSEEGYVRAIITVRDGTRSFNINLVNGASSYWKTTPYFPIPYSSGLVSGTADVGYPQLTPRLTIAGSTWAPLTYYRNLSVAQEGDVVTVSYDTDGLDSLSSQKRNAAVSVRTTYTFVPGQVSRRDVYTANQAVTVSALQSDFGSYSAAEGASWSTTAPHVATYAQGAVTQYSTQGFETCSLAPFGNRANALSPVGMLESNYSCRISTAMQWAAGSSFETGWDMTYQAQ